MRWKYFITLEVQSGHLRPLLVTRAHCITLLFKCLSASSCLAPQQQETIEDYRQGNRRYKLVSAVIIVVISFYVLPKEVEVTFITQSTCLLAQCFESCSCWSATKLDTNVM